MNRFYAAKDPNRQGWEIRDRKNESKPVEFFRSTEHSWPEREGIVRAWARVLNGATDDLSGAIFELSRLTDQPTALTRETVAEILDCSYPVVFPR
jgi:hypothetical protein